MKPNERLYRTMTVDEVTGIQAEVKLMLHASRDCMRNQGVDTAVVPFDVRDGYYGEAFGILRALQVLGYGYYGAINMPDSRVARWNLKWWMRALEEGVLAEEGYRGHNRCDFCLEHYGKDATRHH